MRLIKQVTSFVEGASIAHRKVRGYIFQERVGCERKQYNIYRNKADKSQYAANLMTLRRDDRGDFMHKISLN